eukprot:2725643-Amphidinium_carterae.3
MCVCVVCPKKSSFAKENFQKADKGDQEARDILENKELEEELASAYLPGAPASGASAADMDVGETEPLELGVPAPGASLPPSQVPVPGEDDDGDNMDVEQAHQRMHRERRGSARCTRSGRPSRQTESGGLLSTEGQSQTGTTSCPPLRPDWVWLPAHMVGRRPGALGLRAALLKVLEVFLLRVTPTPPVAALWLRATHQPCAGVGFLYKVDENSSTWIVRSTPPLYRGWLLSLYREKDSKASGFPAVKARTGGLIPNQLLKTEVLSQNGYGKHSNFSLRAGPGAGCTMWVCTLTSVRSLCLALLARLMRVKLLQTGCNCFNWNCFNKQCFLWGKNAQGLLTNGYNLVLLQETFLVNDKLAGAVREASALGY